MDLEKEKAHRPSLIKETGTSESTITSANRLLTDLKIAYTNALKDKEGQIQSLKEEISNLKTLVQVLESENEKLARAIN